MIIHLTKDLEQFVHDAVSAGLYAREDDVIREALTRLKQAMPKSSAKAAPKARRAKPAEPEQGPLTPEELNQRLLAAGLVTRLPDPAEDIDDDEFSPSSSRGNRYRKPSFAIGVEMKRFRKPSRHQ